MSVQRLMWDVVMLIFRTWRTVMKMIEFLVVGHVIYMADYEMF